jgi:hypothetical protein
LKKKLTRAANPSTSPLSTIFSNFPALSPTLPPLITSPALPLASPPSTTSPAPSLASPPFTISPTPPFASPPSTTSPALPTAISTDLKPLQTSTNDLQPPPNTTIDLDNEAVARATGRLLRFQIPATIRDRMWQLHVSEPCTLSLERRITGRIRVPTRKAKSNTQRAARSWQFCP